jgi:copper chaperone CopZ
VIRGTGDAHMGAERVKISVLYFKGCPNHAPTVERLRSLVARHGLEAEIEELEVTSPDDVERLRFLGSPTVQVDGLDIEPAARARSDFAMSCRIYQTPDGLPGLELLEAALGIRGASAHGNASMPRASSGSEACCSHAAMINAPTDRVRPATNWAGAAIVGSVATAMLSSACCWLPLLALAMGASAAGVSSVFVAWRPALVTVAVLLLGVSGYLTFARSPAAGGACCSLRVARRMRWQRAAWLGSAAVAAAFVFFPGYVGRLIGVVEATVASGAEVPVVFTVEGMHCEGCAASLTATLSRIDGVQGARVDYASKSAQLWVSDQQAIERVLDAVRRAGFSASVGTMSNTP